MAVANVENAQYATKLLAQTSLRKTIGTRPLHEIISERETISGGMQASMEGITESWGIKVERVEINEVQLPVQLQRAMAGDAEGSRETRIKIFAAEGEQVASRALRVASEIVRDNPADL